MTVEVDQVTVTAQDVAEDLARRAECEAEEMAIGDRFTVVDRGELSRSSQMSTMLRFATINFARKVKHDSSYNGIHWFEKIR